MDITLARPSMTARERSHRSARSERSVRTPAILAWMLVAIAAVTALAFWDEERESASALNHFAREQSTLAESLTASLQQRLDTPGSASEDWSQKSPGELLAAIRAIERPGTLRVFVTKPGVTGLVGSNGEVVRSKILEAAQSDGFVRLSREQAAEIGLPARTALAGVRTFEHGGKWTVAAVATARAERDREVRAQWRLVLSVLLASSLVLAFGGLAMRKQRKELELSHELAVATLRTKRDERLQRADKLATMGALATGIAHEVSTPLGVILGRAEQLLPRQQDERARRSVEAIVQQGERIHAVIRGFLGLARGGQPSLVHESPAALARAAVELVEHRFEKAGVRLTTDIPGQISKVACDTRLFEQVLVNLLLNACDACAEGGTVSLAVREGAADDDGGERVAFVVTDDGEGISEGAVERVTEPFFTTKPEGKGTGLGLAIANEIVKHHRGSLTLRPNPDGKGTRASVELPIVPREDHG